MVSFLFSLCLESLKLLQLVHAVYPSHCYVAHVNRHEVHRQVNGPWSAHAGRQDLEGRTVERGKLQSILVFLTKSLSLDVSDHSQEYQYSFIWTFIDITLQPISPKQNSFLCAWKSMFIPTLALCGFFIEGTKHPGLSRTVPVCLVSSPVKHLSLSKVLFVW